MEDLEKSILVVGFNTRPLTYSLKKAGYEVYAVDFFGDLDLYPNVKDSFVLTKELGTDYSTLKDKYSKLLAKFTIKMLRKYPEIDYILIGSGMDDAFEERLSILNEIKEKNIKIKSLNNDIKSIENARNIENIYKYLKFHKFKVPFSLPYQNIKFFKHNLRFPLIFKKYRSAGGINVLKIENFEELSTLINFERTGFNPSDWLIQEYIEGIPISCTTISNGEKCEVISINRQIIGEKLLNPPKEFMYCGNIVPALELTKKDKKSISMMSKLLTLELALKGINGFDYVLKNHTPYLMEINPRIPGSISASEKSFNLNLLDLHIKSFDLYQWEVVKKSIKSKKQTGFTTKLIFFAPKKIRRNLLTRINNLEYIHDKSEPSQDILKGEPLCTILFNANSLLESYNGAKRIVIEINNIIDVL
ncbi:MAG: ATP-grasp domain-containing protein [Promethearchaeota archaeon]|jgi:predicted ATP-grasp superfamily ATP-dependent carboligase